MEKDYIHFKSMLTSGPQKTIWGGKILGRYQVQPLSSSEQCCWPALVQINQRRYLVPSSLKDTPQSFLERGGCTGRLLTSTMFKLWGVFLRCIELRAKAQHAAIWEIYRNTFSLHTFPALISEVSLSALRNINACSHCPYFKVHVSCYEVTHCLQVRLTLGWHSHGLH